MSQMEFEETEKFSKGEDGKGEGIVDPNVTLSLGMIESTFRPNDASERCKPINDRASCKVRCVKSVEP